MRSLRQWLRNLVMGNREDTPSAESAPLYSDPVGFPVESEWFNPENDAVQEWTLGSPPLRRIYLHRDQRFVLADFLHGDDDRELPRRAHFLTEAEAFDILTRERQPLPEGLLVRVQAAVREEPPPRPLETWAELLVTKAGAKRPATTDPLVIAQEIRQLAILFLQEHDEAAESVPFAEECLAATLFQQIAVDAKEWLATQNSVPPKSRDLLEVTWPAGSTLIRDAIAELRDVLRLPLAARTAQFLPLGSALTLTAVEQKAAASALSAAIPSAHAATQRLIQALQEFERATVSEKEEIPDSFTREGKRWVICFAGQTCEVPVNKGVGLGYLQHLLVRPERGIHVRDLEVACRFAELIQMNSGNERLDPQALKEYQRRYEELGEIIENADANDDTHAAEQARGERQQLGAQLKSDLGLGKRPRRDQDEQANCRKRVVAAIERAIVCLRETLPALAAHLDQSLVTGSTVTYAPLDKRTWLT